MHQIRSLGNHDLDCCNISPATVVSSNVNRRRLFNFVTAISIVLFIATCALWYRSYRKLTSLDAADSFNFTHHDPLYWLISEPGRLVLCRQLGRNWGGVELESFHMLGVHFGGTRGSDGSMLWNLEMPYWLIACVIAIVPCIRIEFWRRDRRNANREKRGNCRSCGYDLRATPDRCPECGTLVANSAVIVQTKTP